MPPSQPKSYQNANKLRAELILNNIIASIEKKDSKYMVYLPPINDRGEMAKMLVLLRSAGVSSYKIS